MKIVIRNLEVVVAESKSVKLAELEVECNVNELHVIKEVIIAELSK